MLLSQKPALLSCRISPRAQEVSPLLHGYIIGEVDDTLGSRIIS